MHCSGGIAHVCQWEAHGLVGAACSVLSHALLFDLVFCYAGQAGKSRKHGATSQDGLGKSRKDWAWPLPRWARLVKAGRAGGHLAGLPAWSPHSSTGERVAAQQASPAILPESKLVAPGSYPTSWSRPNILSNALHAACPAQSCPAVHCCISEHSAQHTHTHYIDRTYKNHV